MPRSGGIYTVPVGTDGIPNTTISSTAYNNFVHDVEADLNLPRPIVAGGTGANNATDAKINLGITDDITVAKNTIAPACGRLYYNSPNTISFLPYNGNLVKIGGKLLSIGAGINGNNTNVRVNNVPGQNLVVQTNYLVCLVDIAGVPTFDFVTTLAHSADPATGVETPTTNRNMTVIGLVHHSGSGFINTTKFRGVMSWFNRRSLNIRGDSTAGATTTSGSPTEVTTAARVNFIPWSDDDVLLGITGAILSGSAGTPGWQVGLDGSALGLVSYQTIGNATWWGNAVTYEPFNTNEVLHYSTVMGIGGGASMAFHAAVVGMIRG